MAEYEALIQNLRSIDEYDTGYAKLIYDAADAIEELEKVAPRWIPVTKRLPREEETVLTWGKQGVILFDWLHDGKWCCFGEATHWMPLPTSPKEE